MKSGNLQGTTYTFITTGYVAAISYNKMAVGSCPQKLFGTAQGGDRRQFGHHYQWVQRKCSIIVPWCNSSGSLISVVAILTLQIMLCPVVCLIMSQAYQSSVGPGCTCLRLDVLRCI